MSVFLDWIEWIGLIFGLVVGSFLNVVIYRLPRELSIVTPRSRCVKCEKPIAWYQNIPVVSYLLLRGKCRSCGVKISFQYPLVELITGALYFVLFSIYPLDWLLFCHHLPFVSILIAVTFIDLEHRIIPDSLDLGGLALGLATAYWVPGLGLQQSMIGAAIGFFGFLFFAWSYFKITGRMGLGGGDVKLLAMLGAFLGPMGVFATVLISSVAGSVIGIAWALINREKEIMKVAIPYGPFLVLGALYYYFFGAGFLYYLSIFQASY